MFCCCSRSFQVKKLENLRSFETLSCNILDLAQPLWGAEESESRLKMVWWTAAFCWPSSSAQSRGFSSGKCAGRKAKKVRLKNGFKATVSPNTNTYLKVSWQNISNLIRSSVYEWHGTVSVWYLWTISDVKKPEANVIATKHSNIFIDLFCSWFTASQFFYNKGNWSSLNLLIHWSLYKSLHSSKDIFLNVQPMGEII